MKRFILVLAAMLVSSFSLAADLPTKQTPYRATDPVDNWRGFYAGFNTGVAWGDFKVSGVPSFSSDGWIGGGQFGYRQRVINDVVLGLEVDGQFGSLNDSITIAKGVSASHKTRSFETARLVLGVANGPWLIYGTAGVAGAQGKGSLTVGSTTLSDSANHLGYAVGAGVEWQIPQVPSWSVAAEYLYLSFGSASYCAGVFGPVCIGVNGNLNDNVVRAKLNYRFGS
jgi:outer membrane immunogenic protein